MPSFSTLILDPDTRYYSTSGEPLHPPTQAHQTRPSIRLVAFPAASLTPDIIFPFKTPSFHVAAPLTDNPSNLDKMSFAIEVPGEANPLSLQELCKALEAATSMDNSQRQAAGKQLSSWEVQQGYFPSLQVKNTPFSPDLAPLDMYTQQQQLANWASLAIVSLPRQVHTARDPIPCHNTDQERHRQILAPKCPECDQSQRQSCHQIEAVPRHNRRGGQGFCTAQRPCDC